MEANTRKVMKLCKFVVIVVVVIEAILTFNLSGVEREGGGYLTAYADTIKKKSLFMMKNWKRGDTVD